MKKKLFYATMALVALVSCAENEYVGDVSPNPEASGEKAIVFKSNTPRITRSEGVTAAEELGYTFAVYATKTVGTTTSNVFAQNALNDDNTPYWVWYGTSTANTTTSNTNDWEYVGAAGEKTIPGGSYTLSTGQTIKFWDYSASQYDFIAYKAKSGGTVSKVTTSGFKFTGTATQLAGLYIADKLTLTNKANPAIHSPKQNSNAIGYVVELKFRSAAAKVRLGIYETIPGYDVKNVNFRPSGTEFTAKKDKALLSGSFNGSSSSSDGTYNVTYNATTGIAELDNTGTTENYFDFGSFASESNALGTSSVAPMWATGSPDYQNVLPNTDNVNNMILKVDYDLVNSASGETIHVKGATAVVPSIYMKWNPNYAYTYLFKISDNTNGTTGTEGTDPEGIYPITFDAVTIATADGQELGTITTVSTPAITTYQEGSVSTTGITYATASTTEPIYITVNTSGTLASLTTDNIKLYTVASGTTEADLILTNKAKTEVTGANALSILASEETKQDITFASGTTAKFTPAASQTYAVEYLVSAEVAEAYPPATVAVGETVIGLYELSGSDYILTTDDSAQDGKTYYSHTPAAPAVYQYKIIIVQ